MLIYDPVQLKSFGYEYYETDTFAVRYILSKKLFIKSIYIPYGPVIKTEKGLVDFIEFLKSKKFNKVKIDLPKIYFKEIEEKLINLLKDNGFKSSKYIQDSETLVLTPSNWNLSSKDQRYIRNAEKLYYVKIYTNLNESQLDEKTSSPLTKDIYKVYEDNGKEMGYNIKPYEVFLETFKNSITSVVFSNLTNEVCGFVMGYVVNNNIIDNLINDELLILFTALTSEGKEHRLGYIIHQKLFEYTFNELKFNSIDFHGCDSSKGRSYVEFKERFGGTYLSYPGSFEYTKYF